MDNFYNIQMASNKSGLSTHVIRSWEKRYKAVVPKRTKTNRRLFTDKDIEKLRLLKKVVSLGHSISNVANLQIDSLQNLLNSGDLTSENTNNNLAKDNKDDLRLKSQTYIKNCLESITNLNSKQLEKLLKNASIDFGTFYVLENIVSPILKMIGNQWKSGDIRVSHEHLATEVIKNYLKNIIFLSNISSNSPKIVVTTPKGQIHDVGATLVAATCSLEGWEVVYLGPNLPSEEIAGAVKQNNAQALALSIVYPENDPALLHELQNIRELIDSKIVIFAGGKASHSYLEKIPDTDIESVNELLPFRESLQAISSNNQ